MLQNFKNFFFNVTNIKLRYTTSVSVMPLCRNLKVFCISRAVEVRLRSCKARISLQIVLCMCYKSFGKILLVLLAYYYISTRQFHAFLSPLRRHLVYFALLVFYISDFESVEHIYPYRWYSECATKVLRNNFYFY